VQRLGYDPRGDLAELADLPIQGKFEVHVDRVFSLEEAGDAHRHMEERRNRGKIMIHPAD
jgi:NADPH:quinone reductase